MGFAKDGVPASALVRLHDDIIDAAPVQTMYATDQSNNVAIVATGDLRIG